MYSFPCLEPVCCSMFSSNCCFMTFMQISQEAGKVLFLCYTSIQSKNWNPWKLLQIFHMILIFIKLLHSQKGFPGGSVVKKIYKYTHIYICIYIYTCQWRRYEFYTWVGKIPWKGNGYPHQYSCLEHHMDRATWWATVHGVAKSQAWLSNWTCLHAHSQKNYFLIILANLVIIHTATPKKP